MAVAEEFEILNHLLELSQREDCFFVKFGTRARGGMYLGRCFLTTDRAVGEVWAQYKSHPSLFCTVQDDDFTGSFRELSNAYDDLWLNDDAKSQEVLAAVAGRFTADNCAPRASSADER